MKISIGCDPELFLFDKDNKPVSGYGLIEGTKAEPFAVKNGAVQVDGTALEFNTDPAKTEAQFLRNINSVLAQLRAMVPPDLTLKPVAAVFYDGEYFRELPDVAIELGCDPDFCAYGMIENVMNDPRYDKKFMRTASGHVHVGWTEGAEKMSEAHFTAAARLSREMDIWLGLWSMQYEGESGLDRRALYGKAGAFRPKDYGMEYRVLSNFWVGDDAITKQVYRRTQRAFAGMVSHDLKQDMVNRNTVQDVINYGALMEGARLMRDLGVEANDL